MRILTWNIQAGIGTTKYSQYFTHAYRQLFDTASKRETLAQVAEIISPYDVVCLQEVDLGGRRAGFMSQAAHIAEMSGHVHFEVQENRKVRNISRHGNAILSRHRLSVVDDMKLPGKIQGRGALIARVEQADGFVVANTHLSLGPIDQATQLDAIAEALPEGGKWAVCGDLNLSAASAAFQQFLDNTGAYSPTVMPLSFPSWRPRRDLDHIIAGPEMHLSDYRVVKTAKSDHLPVEAVLTVADK